VITLQTKIGPRFFLPAQMLISQDQQEVSQNYFKTKEELEKENKEMLEVFFK